MNTIHYWPIIVSAIASMIIGSIWYGALFGQVFMRAMGIDKLSSQEKAAMQKAMLPSYIGQLIASLVMFFVLAWYITTSLHTGVMGGIANAFGVWIGFVVPLKFGELLWGGPGKDARTLFWLAIGNMLITLLVAGAIIGAWR